MGRVLKSALKVWLRSQLSAVADLKVEIEGGDRNLLTGHIPQVCLTAKQAVYQGIHLSHLKIVAHQIRINPKPILRGKPLQLMQPVPIDLSIVLQATDLNKSLSAPLLYSAVLDLLQTLLGSSLQNAAQPNALPLQLENIQLKNNGLILKVQLPSTRPSTAIIETGLTLSKPWELLFYNLKYQVGSEQHCLASPQTTTSINLGTQVNLQLLTLTPHSLACQGQIEVQP
jgi:hypothetical protein